MGRDDVGRDDGGRPAAGAEPEAALEPGAALEQIEHAMRALRVPGKDGERGEHSKHADGSEALSANQVLSALTLLRELRSQIAGWEPELIEAARALGTSWADLAPPLGVASRQAAERRYLRLRPDPDGTPGTGDERVAAERDRRAADRAVAVWARANAGDLRQLAGQIGALTDLDAAADAHLAALRTALGRDDAADLLGPLAETRAHLHGGHPGLAERVGAVARSTEQVRAASGQRRQG